MKENGRYKPVVIDFDDLCDQNSNLDTLLRLRERDPGFKVTLFAIPTRCSDELFNQYAAHKDWIALGIHGWRHARHECLAWTSEEAEDKVKLAMEIYPGFSPIFKAPNWETCDELYDGLRKSDVSIADHIRNVDILPQDNKHYVYNVSLREDPYVRLHGHIQPYNGTGLEEGWERWTKPPIGSPYLFAHEVAKKGSVVGH